MLNYRELMYETSINRKSINNYIGIWEGRNIFSHVNFSRICNFINRFTDLSIGVFTNAITFTL